MKGFLLALALLSGVFYLVYKSNPANAGGGQLYGSATGEPIDVTPGNFDYAVAQNQAPVLAYFWAPW